MKIFNLLFTAVLMGLFLHLTAQQKTIIDNTSGTATNDGTVNSGEYVDYSTGINSGFGNVIGSNSQLHMDSDNNGGLNIGLISGGGGLFDYMVIYIDSKPGGFANTTTFTDSGDPGRAAASAIGYNDPSGRADIYFAPGFEADYAIPVDYNFAGIFELVGGGSHNYVGSANINPSGNTGAGQWEFNLNLSDIGLAPGSSFKYIVTYGNVYDGSGLYRSDEFHGVAAASVTGGNIGINSVTLNAGDYNLFYSYAPATSTWNGSAKSNDWHTAGNWNNGIPGAFTDVTIPAGLTNYPTITSPAECHDIFLGSSPAGTATLLDNSYLTVSGTATVERYFAPNTTDWHLVSMPVSSGTAGVFTGMYLQSFDETTNSYTEITNENTPLNVMEGFGLYSNVIALNVASFSGDLNFGNQSHGFTANNAGWNLLGNPYTSSIDWEAVTIPANMSNEVHYIEASTGNDLSYVKGSGGSGSQYIPPMQGFFVSATGAGSLMLSDAVRTHSGGSNFYKKDNPNLLVLEATNGTFSDEAWIHFNPEAGMEHDGQFDAYKRISQSNSQLPQIFSFTPSGTKLGVNGMPEASIVPVGFTALESGEFTISAIETGDFSGITLEDLQEGIQINLLNDSYTFYYEAGSEEHRFDVHFLVTGLEDRAADDIIIYSRNHVLYLNAPGINDGTVKVYNMMGQVIASSKMDNSVKKVIIPQSGNYIVSVYSDEMTSTKKIFVK